MTQDFLLIKGYPGTGKTTTIATLIAILINMDKKVLFTSFTNSAVDNLLLKILHDVTNFLVYLSIQIRNLSTFLFKFSITFIKRFYSIIRRPENTKIKTERNNFLRIFNPLIFLSI